jgi:prevent-host-death family protein
MQVNIGEAKKNLAELVDRVEAGEEIIIARRGKPAWVLRPLTEQELAALDASPPSGKD